MANQLNVAQAYSIQTLHERGWSCRRIALELGVDRETVGKYVRQARAPDESNPAAPGVPGVPGVPGGAPLGSEPVGADPKPAKAPTGSGAGGAGEDASIAGGATPGSPGVQTLGPPVIPRSSSGCRPYHDTIVAKLEQGLSAQRIHQDLRADHGVEAPSYYSVRRYTAKLGGISPLPFRRMECAPGLEAQVDFGKGAPIAPGAAAPGHGVRSIRGRPRKRPHVLRIVLSHSRKAYSQVVEKQTTENFIRCLEDAFHHFGGVPQTLVLDNLRAAVSRADWFDPEINPKVQSFCAHYGIVPLPTKPYTPRHKGKVERQIDYVQDNGLKGHQFTSLGEENQHLLHWERTVADTRIHGTIRKQVQEVFEQVEKPALRPLPPERFPFFHEGRRTVHRDGHVEVEKAYYSAPPEYLGRVLWVRWDGHLVRLFDSRMQLIATHTRQETGRFSTLDRHIVDQKINAVERGAAWLLQKAGGIGTQAQRWGEAMVQARGIEGVRVLQGLLSLARKHPHEQINRACGIACDHEAWRLRTIRQLLQRDAPMVPQEHFDFLDEHPIIRPLSDYGRLVHQSFLQPGSPRPFSSLHSPQETHA